MAATIDDLVSSLNDLTVLINKALDALAINGPSSDIAKVQNKFGLEQIIGQVASYRGISKEEATAVVQGWINGP